MRFCECPPSSPSLRVIAGSRAHTLTAQKQTKHTCKHTQRPCCLLHASTKHTSHRRKLSHTNSNPHTHTTARVNNNNKKTQANTVMHPPNTPTHKNNIIKAKKTHYYGAYCTHPPTTKKNERERERERDWDTHWGPCFPAHLAAAGQIHAGHDDASHADAETQTGLQATETPTQAGLWGRVVTVGMHHPPTRTDATHTHKKKPPHTQNRNRHVHVPRRCTSTTAPSRRGSCTSGVRVCIPTAVAVCVVLGVSRLFFLVGVGFFKFCMT